jgi:hypothetical protein
LCAWATSEFKKKHNQVEQNKLCEQFLRKPIGPFVNDLLFFHSPKELEELRIKYSLQVVPGPQVISVDQQLNSKFFKPLEIVWFDPNVNNDENQGYVKSLKEELKINVNTFTEFEKAVQYV